MSAIEKDLANENRPTTLDSSKGRVREQVQTGLEAVKTQLASTGRVIREETLATGQVMKEEAASVANQKLEQARTGTADALSRAARGLEDHASDVSSPRVRQAANSAAHRLDDASSYVRTKSLSDAATDVRADMRANPGRWICAALSAGFLTGLCVHRMVSGRRAVTS